jgi:hypothetical protein
MRLSPCLIIIEANFNFDFYNLVSASRSDVLLFVVVVVAAASYVCVGFGVAVIIIFGKDVGFVVVLGGFFLSS